MRYSVHSIVALVAFAAKVSVSRLVSDGVGKCDGSLVMSVAITFVTMGGRLYLPTNNSSTYRVKDES